MIKIWGTEYPWCDIPYLGKKNIERMISILQGRVDRLDAGMSRSLEYITLLKTRAFSHDTDFKNCGHCKYVRSGTYLGEQLVDRACDITGLDVRNDTPCMLHAGTPDVHASRQERIIKEEQEERDGVVEDIRRLQAILPNVPYRPWLPNLRPHDAFNVGDWIHYRLKGTEEWESSVVINGYRHHDGCVSWHGGGAGTQNPHVIHADDRKYLQANDTVFLKYWWGER